MVYRPWASLLAQPSDVLDSPIYLPNQNPSFSRGHFLLKKYCVVMLIYVLLLTCLY